MHVRNPCNAAQFIHMLMEINAFRPPVSTHSSVEYNICIIDVSQPVNTWSSTGVQVACLTDGECMVHRSVEICDDTIRGILVLDENSSFAI